AASERDEMHLSISVLSPQTPMAFKDEADFMRQLRAGRDGLVISDGNRRALFLPSVWEQLSDPAVFVSRLKQKAGLAPDHWSDTFRAQRFVTESVSIDDLES
ncbi:MAG: AMMECR1 domain-containing protein, partial [Rhodospirillaceae bacterium]|nr:AMMECR1 domain-containing protein [Rhodospirillaceae bacterium]MBT6084613.1 AMMECR1 domain-containing protein [Rhodospirillaceae bacterium]